VKALGSTPPTPPTPATNDTKRKVFISFFTP